MGLAFRAAEDIHSQAGRVASNINLARNFGQTILANGVVDDRKFLYEGIIQLAASLPNDSRLRNDLSGAFIKNLWGGLQHPPMSFLGDEYKYRTANGSNNNIMYPQLGATGQPYARSVIPTHTRDINLPDPGLIFDTLLRRDGLARESPTKVSSSLFHFATIIIHDIFNTRGSNLACSSYLDLGPLYGHDETQQGFVRTFKDGMLKKDTFAEGRLIGQPPGACAMLITFNRFHNYIVGELATINEHGRFSMPDGKPDTESYKAALAKRDNDLFQTGRLVTCGLYVNIILGDYLRTILNLNDNPVASDWKLDPRENFSNVFDPDGTPRGLGNQVSAEFNFVYRWHATTSNKDEEWLNNFIAKEIIPGLDPTTVSPAVIRAKLHVWFRDNVPADKPETWTFNGLKRVNGAFKDADLVDILTAATDTVSGAFGARNTPVALKAVEMLGIKQGREWGLASLNEFRQFFKLKPFTSFKEVNSQPGIAETLEALYGHPDNIELYPGLMAEEAKPPFSPGSGLCPGYTISEAILSDATTLVRGDRFYALEYGPQSLTSFGFKEVASDYDVAGGGVMYKLLMRAFPGWYRNNSVYAMYPFSTPDRTREIFHKNGLPHGIQLSYDQPQLVPPPVPVLSYKSVINVLNNQQSFKVPWGEHTYQLTGHDYMLSGDRPANAKQRKEVNAAMYKPQDTLEQVRKFYETVTADLIHKNKRKLGNQTYQIDIVKDIGNLAHAMFTARFLALPLKEDPNSHGPGLTAQEIYDAQASLFQYVFLDFDTAKSYKHRVEATKDAAMLGSVMRRVVESAKHHPGLIKMLMGLLGHGGEVPDIPGFGRDMVLRLLSGGKSVEDVVWELVPTQAAAAATQGAAWAQLIDLYMSDDYKDHWPAIVALAQSSSPTAFEKLRKYALEGFRLYPAAAGVLRVAAAPNTPLNDGGQTTALPAGAGLFVDFITAGRDPSKFPEPAKIRLDRPEEIYIHHGWGPHQCLGRAIVTTAGAAMLRAFARSCPNVRRASGPAGEIKTKLFGGAFPVFLAEDGGSWEAFPVSKKVLFDVWAGANGSSTNGHGRANGHSNGYHANGVNGHH